MAFLIILSFIIIYVITTLLIKIISRRGLASFRIVFLLRTFLFPSVFICSLYIIFNYKNEINIFPDLNKIEVGQEKLYVVEGEIREFVAMVPGRGKWESFYVNEVYFRYSDYYFNGGYNKTSLNDGILKNGIRVRIVYKIGDSVTKNTIMKIDIIR